MTSDLHESQPKRAGTATRLLLWRGLPTDTSPGIRAVTGIALGLGALLIAATSAIHLHLWLDGYRHVPRLGVLFLLQSITGFVLTPMLLLGRYLVLMVAAAAFMAASAAGLLLSATVGFLGIHDGLGVPWAGASLLSELLGLLLLGAASFLTARRALKDL